MAECSASVLRKMMGQETVRRMQQQSRIHFLEAKRHRSWYGRGMHWPCPTGRAHRGRGNLLVGANNLRMDSSLSIEIERGRGAVRGSHRLREMWDRQEGVRGLEAVLIEGSFALGAFCHDPPWRQTCCRNIFTQCRMLSHNASRSFRPTQVHATRPGDSGITGRR